MRAGRRARAASAPARGRGAARQRDGRQRAEERRGRPRGRRARSTVSSLRRRDRFEALRDTLALSYDDFLRTSSDPRHRPGVERLWRACAAAGDLYEREYSGLYCDGCEAFVVALPSSSTGTAPSTAAPPVPVSERNWFFRLSRYRERLLTLLESGALRIEPEQRRNEVLSFVRRRARGLQRLAAARARSRLGDPGARRSEPGRLRLVRRARQLPDVARVRRRRRPLSTPGGTKPTSACT